MKLFRSKREYNALYEQLMEVQREKAELQKKVHKLRKQNMEEFLNEYRYAILVDENYRAGLWNDGRVEEGVREIRFFVTPNTIATLEIEK